MYTPTECFSVSRSMFSFFFSPCLFIFSFFIYCNRVCLSYIIRELVANSGYQNNNGNGEFRAAKSSPTRRSVQTNCTLGRGCEWREEVEKADDERQPVQGGETHREREIVSWRARTRREASTRSCNFDHSARSRAEFLAGNRRRENAGHPSSAH